MAFKFEQGHYGNVPLDNPAFVLMAQSPKVMADENRVMGLIVDEHVSEAQLAAVVQFPFCLPAYRVRNVPGSNR